jgi:signal transduction histidine kinase/ligand-binding sensor domain-containing protein
MQVRFFLYFNRVKHCLLFIACLAVMLLSARAQQLPPLAVEKYDYNQGLSHESIRCLFRDRQGFIWLGTAFGLNRFDGIGFKKWLHISGDSNSLPGNFVNRVTQDKDGFIWVSTTAGIAKMDPSTGIFASNLTGRNVKEDGYNLDANVFFDTEDRMWTGSLRGVTIMDKQMRLIKHLPIALEPTGAKLNRYVYDFLEDGAYIYAATSYGLYCIDKRDFSYRQYLLPRGETSRPNDNALQMLCRGAGDIIWIGSWYKGLVWFNKATGQLQARMIPAITGGQPVLLGNINAVQWLQNSDDLFLTAPQGLYKVNSSALLQNTALTAKRCLPADDGKSAPGFEGTTPLLTDTYNNLWIGAGGLLKMPLNPPFLQTVDFSAQMKTKYPAVSMAATGTPGIFWLQAGPNNILYNAGTGSFSKHPLGYDSHDQRQLIRAGQHFYMAGKQGLRQYNLRMQLAKEYDTLHTPALHTQHFNKVFADSRGNIWLGTYRKGIILFRPAEQRFTPFFHRPGEPFDLFGNDVEHFAEDAQGNIWVATSVGLLRYRYADGAFDVIKPCTGGDCLKAEYIYPATGGQLYFGTRDGLYRFDAPKNQAVRILLSGPEISNSIFRILEDRNGNLWLGTNNGLLLYNPQTKKTRQFSRKDGLPTDVINNLFMSISDSQYCMGTENALTFFNPLKADGGKPAPPPVLVSVTIDEQPLSLIQAAPARLRHNQSIRIDFASLDNYNDGLFQYRLEGLEQDWQNIGAEHTLRFSNLPAGDYTVHIRTANRYGEWNGEPMTFSFRVKPPFYKTWWFMTIAALLAAAAAYALYRYRMRQVIAMERLRTRIATDLHDDIGATLSSISMYSEALKGQVKEKLPHLENILEKMGESSRSMVGNMSDIVWAINPDNDDADKMIQRMEDYVKDICAAREFELQFECDEKIRQLNFTLDQRRNIYLVFKEAVNNAVKYAAAARLSVLFSLSNKTVVMTVKDDGKGFDTVRPAMGNGLRNMRYRAAEINARLQVESEPGKGTSIRLEANI